ncbi:MAG: TIM barrel protein [Clostridia bacterium]|nr:TIM barrel protein [Clostridia bacterium]
MRLSVCIPMFFKGLPLHEAIKRVAELGYDACEMWKVSEEVDLSAAAAACKEYGVEFQAICTDYFECTGGDAEAYVAGVRSAAEKAKALGAKLLISQVGKDTGAPAAEQHANIVRCLKAAIPVLEETGMTIVIEPLNTLVNHKGYYLWSSIEGFEILREVDHPQIKMVYDIYHQQIMEGNIITNVTENLPLIAHLHSAGCPGRHELNNGENDYKKIFEAIDAAGYTGVCGLEYKPLLPPEESLALTKKLYT